MTETRTGRVLRALAAAYAVVVVVLGLLVVAEEVGVGPSVWNGWLLVVTAPACLFVVSVVGLVAPDLPVVVQALLLTGAGLLQAALLRSAGRPG